MATMSPSSLGTSRSGKGHCNIIPEWWCLQECQSSADQQQSSGQTTGLTWGDDQIVVPEAEMWDRESGLTPPAAWLVSTITTPGARLHLLVARECSTRDVSRFRFLLVHQIPLVHQAPESPGRPGLPGHPSSPGPAVTCLPTWRGRRFTRPTVPPGSEDQYSLHPRV